MLSNKLRYTNYLKRYVLSNLKNGRYLSTSLSLNRSSSSPLDDLFPPTTQPTDPFLAASGGSYIETMYQAWQKDPNSVHLSWQLYFSNINQGILPAYQPPPNLIKSSLSNGIFPTTDNNFKEDNHSKTYYNVKKLVDNYYSYGHYISKLDPLNLKSTITPPELQLSTYSLTEDDLNIEFQLGSDLLPNYFKRGITSLKLSEIIEILNDLYCSTIGYEFNHINNTQKIEWLKEKIEQSSIVEMPAQVRKAALERLVDADNFEYTFATKFTTVKRYGLEGGDAMIPGILALIDHAAENKVKNMVIGMPHRGRLNLYCNVMGQPAENIYAEFSGKVIPPHPWSGDSSYHLSAEHTHQALNGHKINLSLSANPSHLEAVNPVSMGTTRSKQTQENGEVNHNDTICLLLHGDAAVAGQGVVYETIGFHKLPSFNTGGTIHMVVNNQIGFTTNPHISRSFNYCCDIAKAIQAPVIHVNGDDIDSVLKACQIAVDWRQKFNEDIFIDLICYRKNGHNEVDQPSYTQPKMYNAIAKHTPVLEKYSARLLKESLVNQKELDLIKENSLSKFDKAYQKSRDLIPKNKNWEIKSHPQLMSPKEIHNQIAVAVDTGAKREDLIKVAETFSSYPNDFKIHKNLIKVLQNRKNLALEGKSIDWATAELLAFGTLLLEGSPVRISGQDVERGTFSQRHAVLIDQSSENKFTPLNSMSNDQALFYPCNSSLSEFGVLGFEFGYSINDPNSLVIWEAQFGDFSNVAQCMIDQFIASSEQKWLQSSGICIALPHGFDGNGPEHSSGRIERYLQLTDEDPNTLPSSISRQHQDINWSIINCTTPANYFHALRRQIKRSYRKPLISFNGKGILRHPIARSTYEDLELNSNGFQRAYPEQYSDKLVKEDKIRSHILCSGQVYYRLLKAREMNNIDDVAISRIEELAPFPFDLIREYCDKYPNAEVVWCQEEPINMGPYSHVLPRIITSLGDSFKKVRYSGRGPSSAVAVGNKQRHYQEEYKMISTTLYGRSLEPKSISNGTPVF
ncbi:2-oxoglutarate dehydrogenase E1 component [Neoconidiobolus thromboides FSU 785]|nr:2-oxoglutarate dehydrogenase E1 component [Neoconidiobolus thromboides FSU 785]